MYMKIKIVGNVIKYAVKDLVEDVIETSKKVIKNNVERYNAFKEYSIQQNAINELKAEEKKAIDNQYSSLEKKAAEMLKKNLSVIKF